MDETLSIASTSIYHSALSSADSDSPRPFQTPFTSRDPFNPIDSDSQQLLLEIEATSLLAPLEQINSEDASIATNRFEPLHSQQLFQELQATTPPAALQQSDSEDTARATSPIGSLNSQQLLQDIQFTSPLARLGQRNLEDTSQAADSIESLSSQQLLQEIQATSPLAGSEETSSEETPRALNSIESLNSQQLLQDIQTSSPLINSPLLERYISSDTAWSGSTTSTLQDSMPAITRLQERHGVSQASSRVSSPMHSTLATKHQLHDLPTTTSKLARATSPVILTNMLQDVLPHSPSYVSQLRIAVDELVPSLMERGRIREGHGIRELYQQSFKDPGSADLLDALLRQQATERQLWDFGRYVEDVNRLNSQPPIVVIPVRGPASVDGGPEVDRRRSADHVDADVEDNTPSIAQIQTSPRVVIEAPAAVPLQASQNLLMELEPTPDSQNHPAAVKVQSRVSRRKRRKERRRLKQAETSASAPTGVVHEVIQRLPKHVPQTTSRLPEGGKSLVIWASEPSGNTDTVADVSIQHRHERRRKKKKRNKMFLGANGPVYSTNVLNVPLSKQIGSFGR